MGMPDKFVSFVLYFIKKQKKGFFILLITSFASAISATVWPQITGQIIDKLSNKSLEFSSKNIFLTILGFWLFTETLLRTRGYVYSKLIPKLEVSIREHMFRHVSLHSHSYFSKNFIGSIAGRLAELPKSISLIIDIMFTEMMSVIVGLFIASLFFLYINQFISLIITTWLVVHIFICIVSGKKSAKLSKIQFETRTLLNGKIIDLLNNHLAVRIFNSYDREEKNLSSLQKKEQEKHKTSLLFIEKIKFILTIVDLLGISILFYFSIDFCYKGIISIGDLVAIITTTINLLSIMAEASDELGYLFREIGLCQQGLRLIQDPIQIKNRSNPIIIKSLNDNLTFDNVSFSYEDKSISSAKYPYKKILKNISLKISKGESIALIGYSGSGKTTFVNLIPRFFDPTEGVISIDGIDIKKISLEHLRKLVSLVPQDPILFHRSIADNIKYSSPEASDEAMIEASKLAMCHDFIKDKEFGYNTNVGEKGSNLSGGERQRIMIARAFLSDANIVIMDEATSSLDAKNTELIRIAIESLKNKKKTLIIISHNLPSITPFVDKVVVFYEGAISQVGHHKKLLEEDGIYKTIWDASFVI